MSTIAQWDLLLQYALQAEAIKQKLRKLNTHCPIVECSTNQIELRDWRTAKYKCRHCKHKWRGRYE